MDELLITVEEAARRLQLARSTVYALVLDGKIKSVKVGRARRIPVKDLDRFVVKLKARGAA